MTKRTVLVGVIRADDEMPPERHYFDRDKPLLPEVYRLIDCDLVEVVRPGAGGVLALVDEEGLLRGKPLNEIASLMLGRPIVGDVAIVKDGDLK